MGTTLGDATYSGLAHAAPPISPNQLWRIERRWQEWLPWCTLTARHTTDFESRMLSYKTLHRTRVVTLLTSSISWFSIRHHRLDDPRWSQEEFASKMSAVIARIRQGRGRKRKSKYPPGAARLTKD